MKKYIAKIIEQNMKATPPQWYDMYVTMNVKIKKGRDKGAAVIPCAFETLTHSIDLNPSLIRKKDSKDIGYFSDNYKFIEDKNMKGYKIDKARKKLYFNPKDYMLELTRAEKKQRYYLHTISRCNECGQKTIIADVRETHYRSCPIIQVKLSDKATEDLTIPVKFGCARASFYAGFLRYFFVLILYILMLVLLHVWAVPWFFWPIVGGYLAWTMFFQTVRVSRLLKWYLDYRPNAVIKPKQPLYISILQTLGL